MGITAHELMEAINIDDIDKIEEMLDQVHLNGKSDECAFSPDIIWVARRVLGFASVAAHKGVLDSKIAEELIRRTARIINIFDFTDLVIDAGLYAESFDTDNIPKEVRKEFKKNQKDATGEVSSEVVELIGTMSREQFFSLLALIYSDETTRLNIGYNYSIIKRVRKECLITDGLLFSFMASSPHKYEPGIETAINFLTNDRFSRFLFGKFTR